MSATENAMARFLFAILQQKSLKDIDWNEVAASPFLSQKISNGHAARMRYSRFRASMLGTEPRPRNRTNPDKNRVTKTKKEDGERPKTKAVKVEKGKEGGEESKSQSSQTSLPSPPLKDDQDFIHPEPSSLDNIYPTPTSMATPMPDIQPRMQWRHLTPCSDSDALTTSPHIYTPAVGQACPTDMLLGHTDTPFDYTGSAATTTTGSWQPTLPAYAGYGMGYELDTYATAYAVSDSQQNEQHAAEQLQVHAAMLEHESHTGMIKQEDCEAQEYQC
ncbi:hypothetical protein SMACR_04184 [Sordaria macrospora]|uniref:WGS project CABT00000000 data, contig 2.15 n=2 Tax=Sordaria macrospora TaxID=5147 RepID=F7VZK7_SORMK|nr:uncharacterized protein SMAC_04184 [Sordaria macrospora k-hell]KAA8628926.1 hypothetical protein SMACR_04184 [Sordaria macrospora]WPJ64480.1 hypothetical protein SMAC4_04184 [Sordaria macrospora]CCC10955.1 unnamed protein product [Sordaria macrospora k-hell]